MNINKVNQFLSQASKCQCDINTLLDEANFMHKLAAECDGANAKSAAITIRRYLEAIDSKVKEYIGLRQKIKNAIDKVNDADCRLLLTKRYLQNKTWEQIAEDMNFSVAHIYRLRKKALGLLGNNKAV